MNNYLGIFFKDLLLAAIKAIPELIKTGLYFLSLIPWWAYVILIVGLLLRFVGSRRH
jgi:hypothetical protein